MKTSPNGLDPIHTLSLGEKSQMRDKRRTFGAALLGSAIASASFPVGAKGQDPLPPMPPKIDGAGTTIPSPVILPPNSAVPPPKIIQGVPSPGSTEGLHSITDLPELPQAPESGIGSPPMQSIGHGHQPGPIGRAFHHLHDTIKDRMVGEPERFVEPPLGWSVQQNFLAHRQKVDIHRFTLYRTDFKYESEQLTADGLRRLGRMMSTLQFYPGPLLVEDDPTRPGLAEARRKAVIDLAARNGDMIDPSRMIVGRSPFLGGRGDLSEIYEGVLLDRSLRAPTVYPLNPNPNADFQN